MFYEKELQKANQTEFRIQKVLKKNMINYMWSGNVVIISLLAG